MTPWHPLPHQIFEFLEYTPGTVLLHSSRPGGSSVSRLFTDPLHTIEVRDLAELPALFAAIEAAVERGHFAVGYFAYECAPYFEPAVPVRTGYPDDSTGGPGARGGGRRRGPASQRGTADIRLRARAVIVSRSCRDPEPGLRAGSTPSRPRARRRTESPVRVVLNDIDPALRRRSRTASVTRERTPS